MSQEKIERWNEVDGNLDNGEKLQAFLDSTTDAYAILQLRRTDETVYERFESYEALKRQGKEPNIDHYDVVYVAPLSSYTDQTAMLEGLYTKFNVERPEDFRGHSLSVSDIVALKQNGVVSCHYVDSRGFKALPDFLKPENYLKNAEMAMEDDYGMIDGVINNGRSRPWRSWRNRQSPASPSPSWSWRRRRAGNRRKRHGRRRSPPCWQSSVLPSTSRKRQRVQSARKESCYDEFYQ